MSKINQIQIRYAPIEDRILLRLNTADSSEFRFWITRRYANIIAPALLRMLRSSEDIQEHKEEKIQEAVMSFQHQDAIQNADFARTFQNQPRQMPLGAAPILLSKLTVKKTAEGNPMVCMYPEQGQGIDLTLQRPLLHSISKLLADALREADWGVEFRLPEQQATEASEEKPALLN